MVKGPLGNPAQQTMFALCSQRASPPSGRHRVEDLVQDGCPALEGVVPAAIVPATGTEAAAKLVVGGQYPQRLLPVRFGGGKQPRRAVAQQGDVEPDRGGDRR